MQAFTEFFFCLASLLERALYLGSLLIPHIVPRGSGRRFPQVLMYRSQYVLNGNTNIWRVARGLDADMLWIPLVVFKLEPRHRWVYSGGG